MVVAGVDGIDTLFYKGGDDVGAIGIEIISWAVEVDRDKEYAVETIFGAIGLGLHKEHFFCQAVGCVCLLWVAVP